MAGAAPSQYPGKTTRCQPRELLTQNNKREEQRRRRREKRSKTSQRKKNGHGEKVFATRELSGKDPNNQSVFEELPKWRPVRPVKLQCV